MTSTSSRPSSRPRGRGRALALGALGLTATLLVGGLAGCGDDDDITADAASTTAPAATDAPVTDAAGSSEGAGDFCEGFLGIEAAVAEGPPDDPAAIEAFVEEQLRPNLELIDGNEPESIAGEVEVMTAAIEELAASGDPSVFETPEYSEAAGVVYSSLDDVCEVPVVEVTAVDFAYEGMPETLEAGPTSFVMTNESTSDEVHEMSFVKLRDDVDLTLEELLALPEAESEQYIEIFGANLAAPSGQQAGVVVDLVPGRWAYVCFIPTGTSQETDGTGPPHFMAGMSGELIVE